jgi:hypothetical protein
MPVALSYPGVYIQEIPSGVRTITGVATSVAAFVGWAPKGSTDKAELVLSWSDYNRKFKGMDRRSLLGYAIYHFFLNGGQQAYIVRLTHTDAVNAEVTLGALKVTAKNPGEWANSYAVITKKQADPNDTRFRLVVADVSKNAKGDVVEVFENLSMNSNDRRFVVNVLKDESAFISANIIGNLETTPTPPADTAVPDTGIIPGPAKLVSGADGIVLQPDAANFETALKPTNGVGGIYHLDRVDLFNILCIPGETNETVLGELQKFCLDHRAFLIADCKSGASLTSLENGPNSSLTGNEATNAAFYFPWVKAPDPLQENRLADFPPCGFIAGLYARTDTNRGVWKAPAGIEASLAGVAGVKFPLTNNENGVLNPKAVNCIRNFPVYGTVIWGARTLQGNDERGSEWKYIPVRRTALFIEESLYRGTQWVVFEPNDEPLWSQIRLNIGSFMHSLFQQGAFQGSSPKDAYFVKCDKETTTQDDINRGIVNIHVGFAPLKPAEFVVISIQQMAGQIQV